MRLTGGATGTLPEQVGSIMAALDRAEAGPGDLALLRVFYRHDAVTADKLRSELAARLPPETRCTLTLVPVAQAGPADGLLTIEAIAVVAHKSQLRCEAGLSEGPFVAGLRRGKFVFLSAVVGAEANGIVAETTSAMMQLGATLKALGAGFGDVVRMNRWYHAAGTKDDWEPSARAVAGFYAEPGPIATAISLPSLLAGGASIQIELMAMLAEDGTALPKQHSWPEGSWDWPIHLPYKHGLACCGLGFVGGQVSLDANSQVIDPEHLDLQVARSLANIERVIADFGAKSHEILHLGVYFEMPPGGLGCPSQGAEALMDLSLGYIPVALIGFDHLSYPKMRVEIEAIFELDET
ncbi:MAG: hypothetical protein ABIV25_08150 [Paracoccaceae bacterium]